MKITTLIENTQDKDEKLKNEHGLSMFIEGSNCNVLFDTGKTGDFIENAKKLNVDLKKTDILVLSHAHYDHCGGVKRLLETYDIKPKLVVSNHFFNRTDKYHYSDGSLKSDFSKEPGYAYIGTDFDKKYVEDKEIRIESLEKDVLEICDNVFVCSNFNKYYDFEKINPNMQRKVNDEYIIDTFDEEVALGIKTKKGLVILLGCAHPGFLNMVKTIEERTNEKIVGIIGGTHLIEADDERIKKSVDYLNKSGVELLGLSHCTGEKAVEIFNKECKTSFTNRTGTIVELD
ncbi:MBL fold metallo-hydrolase [Clostridium botulinum]|uniref:MBL fold metallo-hydrolase n=1 Tax=unclassified Clostridium TaxID=2614128 RepID=UPI0013C555CB|nr:MULTISPECIES: MBL fold metallo-hydrolase [unclassified Clostridium]MBY7007407.1 MBL fold metallo-hydrolase [Clostridium botulinum]NFH71757.1 MBL fold metallo-hydrolase [Clostridium botulinum]NFI00703.1 MBL fold metallo-hydrolase [Clostridium botulinum]NFI62463.1 MBL fold metallo-hydrolase [Clostridium botulinum]NFI80500.1 MBL fold metallo-hydrolase [Clostridium botulinum]